MALKGLEFWKKPPKKKPPEELDFEERAGQAIRLKKLSTPPESDFGGVIRSLQPPKGFGYPKARTPKEKALEMARTLGRIEEFGPEKGNIGELGVLAASTLFNIMPEGPGGIAKQAIVKGAVKAAGKAGLKAAEKATLKAAEEAAIRGASEAATTVGKQLSKEAIIELSGAGKKVLPEVVKAIKVKPYRIKLSTTRGGIPFSEEVIATPVGDNIVARMPNAYSNRENLYGVYTKEGGLIKGGFDKHKEALSFAGNPENIKAAKVAGVAREHPEVPIVPKAQAAKDYEQIAGEVPPTKPPVPPTATAAVPEPDDAERALAEFGKAIQEPRSEEAFRLAAQMKSEWNAKRFTQAADMMADALAKGKSEKEALDLGQSALKGIFEGPTTGITIPEKYLNAAYAKIIKVLSLDPAFQTVAQKQAEITATRQALDNALAAGGKAIPRKLGTKGGSAYSRLVKVFGEGSPILEVIEHPEAVIKKLPNMRDPRTGLKYSELEQAILDFKGPELEGTLALRPPKPSQLELGEIPWEVTPARIQKTPEQIAQETLELKLHLGTAPSAKGIIEYPLEPLLTGEKQLRLFPETPSELKGIPYRSRAQINKETLDLMSDILATMKKPEGAGGPTMFASDPTWREILLDPSKRIRQLSLLPQSTRQRVINFLKVAGTNVVDALNVPRAFISSGFDLSMPFRQGLIAGVRHPVAWAKNWKFMIQALKNEEVALKTEAAMRADLDFAWGIEKGLIHPPSIQKGVGYAERLESFASRFAESLPGVRPSQRAATIFIEKLEYDLWKQGVKVLRSLGPKADMNDYKALGELFDWELGRADFPDALMKVAPVLNAAFFSPRLFFSRIALPWKLLSSSGPTRGEALSTLGAYLGFLATIHGIHSLVTGKKTEPDPRSGVFAKMQLFGSTYLDFTGGYAQYIRFAARMVTNTTKKKTGEIESYGPSGRWDTTLTFFQSKDSPVAAMVTDMLKGEAYGGREVDVTTLKGFSTEVYNRLLWLWTQDMIDAMKQDGAWGALAGVAGYIGIGVVTFDDPVAKLQDKIIIERGMKSWEQLTQADKIGIINSNPELLKLMEDEKKAYAKTISGRASINLRWSQQAATIEDNYNKDVEVAAKEFRAGKDGVRFKDKVNAAADRRRGSYENLLKTPEFEKIAGFMAAPLSERDKERMQPEDIARHELNLWLYGNDMVDQYGNYLFEKADERREQFRQQFGDEMLAYTEKYQGIKEANLPEEYRMLKEARKVLKPFWDIDDLVWSKHPPMLRVKNAQISMMERSPDPIIRARGREELKKQPPQMLAAREQVAAMKKFLLDKNPKIRFYYDLFYR